MPQCRTCAASFKSHNTLGRHIRNTGCGVVVASRVQEIQRERRLRGIVKRRIDAVPGEARGHLLRQELPPQLGGLGFRRRADYFNPSDAETDAQGYWQHQDQIMQEAKGAAEDFQNFLDSISGDGRNIHDEATGNAVGFRGGEENDEFQEDAPDADHAPSTVLYHAILNLCSDMGLKTGARSIDRLLRVITQDGFKDTIDMLNEDDIGSHKSVLKQLSSDAQDYMKERGFREVWVVNPENENEGTCLYVRNAADVVKRQMEHASVKRRNFYFEPSRGRDRDGNILRTHPMSADLARRVLPDVTRIVMENGCWAKDRSFMCMLQVYSDKSHMSLSTKAHTFYPLHVAVMNLRSDEKDCVVSLGETIVAYLSTVDKWESIPKHAETVSVAPSRHAHEVGGNGFLDTLEKRDKAQGAKILFRCSVAACLSSIRECAITGLDFKDEEGTPRRGHLVIAAYSGDSPELHLMTCTLQSRCTKCLVPSEQRYKPGHIGALRSQQQTKKHLIDFSTSKTKTDKIFARASLEAIGCSATEPVFLDWPFTSIQGLDVYSISRFDLMHSGPLGVFKHLLDAVQTRLTSDELISPVLKNARGVAEKYKTIRVKVLQHCNRYLDEIDLRAPAVGFSVNFTRGKKKEKLDGLFTEAGTASMLQAKDYKMAQEIMPFVATLIDRYCGDGYPDGESNLYGEDCAPVTTTAFVLYNEMDRAIRRKDMEDVGFTDQSVQEVEKATFEFQEYVVEVFGNYQKSGFSFGKWHAYNHVPGEIMELGACSGFDTSVFESAHTVYKSAHRSTAQRHGSATADTVAVFSRKEAFRARIDAKAEVNTEGKLLRELVKGGAARGARATSAVKAAVHSDSAALAAHGQVSALRNLIRIAAHSEVHENVIRKFSQREQKACRDFFLQLQDVGIAREVLRCIREKVIRGDGDGEEERNVFRDENIIDCVKIHVLKSANIPGWPLPTLQDLVKVPCSSGTLTEVHVVDTWQRMKQRIFSSYSFSHSKKFFKDSVMIEAHDPSSPFSDKVDEKQTGGPRSMWFGRVRAFLRIESGECTMLKGGKEYAIVDYYDVVPVENLDSIDIATGCIKLRWGQKKSDTASGPRHWTDIIPITALRARLHVVPVPRVQKKDQDDVNLPWTEEMFYVNRFKLSNYETTYNKADVVSSNAAEV